MTLVSSTEWPTNRLWSVPTGSDDDLLLSQAVTQKSRTLLLYSDVVNSNIVGDGLHPLVREVYYREVVWAPCISHLYTSNGYRYVALTLT